jgi:hypothetical protein
LKTTHKKILSVEVFIVGFTYWHRKQKLRIENS